MLYELTDTSEAACLFEGWQETLIYSCLQNKAWEACIEACFPKAKKVTRYAIKKKTQFDRDLFLKAKNNIWRSGEAW